jgi:hypothetical protein
MEKTFIKWRMSTQTPLVKIEDEQETKKWIMSQDAPLSQNEIKPITMIEPCTPTSTITMATPEHMTYKQSKEAVDTLLAMPYMVNPEQITLYPPPTATIHRTTKRPK